MKQEGYELINGLLVYFFRICMFTPSCVTPVVQKDRNIHCKVTYTSRLDPWDYHQKSPKKMGKNTHKHTHTHMYVIVAFDSNLCPGTQYLCSHHGEPFGPQTGTTSIRSLTDVNIVDVFSPAIF